MLEKGRINSRQLFLIVFFLTVGDAILFLPSTAVAGAKQDAWIAGILSVAVGSSMILLIPWLGKFFKNLTFVEYSQKILGKWIGKLVSIGFLFYLYMNIAGLLRILGDFMATQMMPNTPIQSIIIIYVCIVVMGVRQGLENIARTSETFFPLVILLFTIYALSLTPQWDSHNIRPFLENGIKPFLKTVYIFGISPFLELAVISMIIPYVNRTKTLQKSVFCGALLGGTLLVLVTLFSILVLGVDHTIRNNYPSYLLAKTISIGKIFERIEAIFAGIWFLTLYFKIAIYFYGFTLGVAQLFGLKEYRPLVLPIGMATIVSPLVIAPHAIYLSEFADKNWPLFNVTFAFCLPLLLVSIATIRKKGY